MNLNEQLQEVLNIKNEIKASIEEKGGSVSNFASYSNAIKAIQTGGGESEDANIAVLAVVRVNEGMMDNMTQYWAPMDTDPTMEDTYIFSFGDSTSASIRAIMQWDRDQKLYFYGPNNAPEVEYDWKAGYQSVFHDYLMERYGDNVQTTWEYDMPDTMTLFDTISNMTANGYAVKILDISCEHNQVSYMYEAPTCPMCGAPTDAGGFCTNPSCETYPY